MSFFGCSISDVFSVLKLTLWLVTTLRNKAVDSYERCCRNYQTLCRVVQYLEVYAHMHNVHNHRIFKTTLREIATLQDQLSSRIDKFHPSLGEYRRQASFFKRVAKGAAAKIKWVHDEEKALERLSRDLEIRINSIHIAVSCPIPEQPSGDQFAFEDACRNIHLISFTYINSWENFYELLLRIHKHKTAIEEGSYILHNSTTGKHLLPSSPCKKPFRDIVASGQRIEMSIIFPYEDSYTSNCPRCKKRRPDTTLVGSTCDKCGLWIRFLDSFEDEADPLTQLAIEDIQNSGLETFVTEFLSEIVLIVTTRPQNERLNDRVNANFPKAEELRRSPKIKDFRRVTFCVPRNPSFRKCSADYLQAEQNLARVMEGSKRHLRYVKNSNSDLPIIIAARAIGSRLGGRPEPFEEFLRSVYLQYNPRSSQRTVSVNTLFPALEAYEDIVENSKFYFHPTVVKTRCFLWVFSRVLALEGKLIHGCSKALIPPYVSRGTKPVPNPLFQKILAVPFIANVVIWRLTFDVVADTVDFFHDSTPPVILGAIFRILKESRKLCLRYLSEGSLESYDFNPSPLTDFEKEKNSTDAAREKWIIAYRSCLESVMRSDGDDLRTVENCKQVTEYLYKHL